MLSTIFLILFFWVSSRALCNKIQTVAVPALVIDHVDRMFQPKLLRHVPIAETGIECLTVRA